MNGRGEGDEMSERGKVIFELGGYGVRRYLVEYRELGGYRWEIDRAYVKKASACTRAEDLIRERGISQVRVVDRGEEES